MRLISLFILELFFYSCSCSSRAPSSSEASEALSSSEASASTPPASSAAYASNLAFCAASDSSSLPNFVRPSQSDASICRPANHRPFHSRRHDSAPSGDLKRKVMTPSFVVVYVLMLNTCPHFCASSMTSSSSSLRKFTSAYISSNVNMCFNTTMTFFKSTTSSNPSHPNAAASCLFSITAARLRSSFVNFFGLATPGASASLAAIFSSFLSDCFISNFAAETVIFVDASPARNSD
mmetsp:Transcript_1970/g.7348  ORF Transcript_1970/g.7348 Transcript_1970/m.7348 type:complete len:236 (-) Transcript_1970:605-1312(-)